MRKTWCERNFGAKPTFTKKFVGRRLPKNLMPFDRVNGDKRLVIFDFFAIYVNQHTNAKFTTDCFVSRMDLGPCF
jgi:hypothetical protein